MKSFRFWAFRRRIIYGTGYMIVLTILIIGSYYKYFYTAPTCFDNIQNGSEQGVDCGGSCTRVCAFTVAPPIVKWAKSFKITQGQYNAVAYVENKNQGVGTPSLKYTFKLYDAAGLITQRSGTTVLPPNNTYPIFEGRINTAGRDVTRTTLSLTPTKLWLPSTFDRSQFKTTSLQLLAADTRPRLNATLINAALTTAKDVEVVATIFDAHNTPLTASQTFVDSLIGHGKSNLVFTWPLPIAKTIRSCDIPTDVTVAIDLSGSMNNDGDTPPEPITSVLNAASEFVNKLHAHDQVSVVTFATNATVALPLTHSFSAASNLIKTLTIDSKEEHGSTNTGDALLVAQQELDSTRHNIAARRVIVLLTDGLATAPDPDPSQYALIQATSLKNDNITLYTIGLGGDVNMDFLHQAASDPTKAYAAPTTATLSTIYQTITAAICEEGAARIDVLPKTNAGFATYP